MASTHHYHLNFKQNKDTHETTCQNSVHFIFFSSFSLLSTQYE